MKIKKFNLFLFILIIVLLITTGVQARSGCCSGHEGVDCSVGAQSNGHVICNDDWTGSSCLYSEMIMCEEDDFEEELEPTCDYYKDCKNWENCINNKQIRICEITESDCDKYQITETQVCVNEYEEIEKIEEICNGCFYENVCLTFGYRINEKYCSIDKNWIEQKDKEETCENNFECKTNVCIDKACVSSGLIQKFFRWLGRFFG